MMDSGCVKSCSGSESLVLKNRSIARAVLL